MIVKARLSALMDTKWHEYALRFGLGGFATVATGLIASKFGPVTGGLFLAFPAIFCASATLVEKHERERKQKAGLRGERRGRKRLRWTRRVRRSVASVSSPSQLSSGDCCRWRRRRGRSLVRAPHGWSSPFHCGGCVATRVVCQFATRELLDDGRSASERHGLPG